MISTTAAREETDTGQALIPARRFDLDWLRVLAFGLLILYHVGMLYVARWGFHYKSTYLSGALESLMLIVNPWRMLILWLISGIAIRFILGRLPVWRFITLRSLRLLLPLLFGILIIVPPQLYFEMSQAGVIDMNYVDFFRLFWVSNHPIFADYQSGIWPHIDVNHLWYLRELWTLSILLCLALPVLNANITRRAVAWVGNAPGWLVITVMLTPTILIDFLLDGDRVILGAVWLIMGYLFAFEHQLWDRIRASRRPMMWTALSLSAITILLYNLYWADNRDQMPEAIRLFGGLIYSGCRFFWVAGLLGLAAAHLNRPSPQLRTLNQAVYPCYIVHQTLLIVAAGVLTPLQLGPFIEPVSVLLITLAGCALTALLVEKIRILRPLFGRASGINWSPTIRVIIIGLLSILLTGFGLEILI